MGAPYKNPENIWVQGRIRAKMTREDACELIPIGIDYLSSIENGRKAPTAQLAKRMSDVYGDPCLFYEYAKTTLIGQWFIDNFHLDFNPREDLRAAGFNYTKELLADNYPLANMFMKIFSDGLIDDSESSDAERIIDEMSQLITHASHVVFLTKIQAKKEPLCRAV